MGGSNNLHHSAVPIRTDNDPAFLTVFQPLQRLEHNNNQSRHYVTPSPAPQVTVVSMAPLVLDCQAKVEDDEWAAGRWIRQPADHQSSKRCQVYTVQQVLPQLCGCTKLAVQCGGFLPKLMRHATAEDLHQRKAAKQVEDYIFYSLKTHVMELAQLQYTGRGFRLLHERALEVVSSGLLGAIEIVGCEVSLVSSSHKNSRSEVPPMATIFYKEVDDGAKEREQLNRLAEENVTWLDLPCEQEVTIQRSLCAEMTRKDVSRQLCRVHTLIQVVTAVVVDACDGTRLFLQLVPVPAEEEVDE